MEVSASRGYVPAVDGAEKRLQKQVEYAAKAVQHGAKAKYLGFYDERGVQLATAKLRALKITNYQYHGGFEGAERVMLCVFEDVQEIDFPIQTLLIKPMGTAQLTHRDYLGAVLGAGLQRQDVGDIVVTEQGGLVYLQSVAAPVLLQGLTQVGRCNVQTQLWQPQPVAKTEDGRLCKTSVASLRLDAVLAAVLNTSRTKAAGLVQQGKVSVNHLPGVAVHYMLQQQDNISIRGQGRIKLLDVGGRSRKNRVYIEYLQY